VRGIFQKLDTPVLRGHLVWIPMLPADNLQSAIAQEAYFQDERITQYWDAERGLGRLVAQTLKLKDPIAWDVYLVYGRGKTWEREILPAPDFWMHQLNERPDLHLNPDRLMAEVMKLI
jgi:hypothetical protein